MKRVNDYLHGLGDEKAFLQEHPYSVLIELEEGADSQELAEDAEVTHRMQTKEVQRQAVSSREACVYPLLAPLGVLEVGRAPDCQLVIDHPSVSKKHAQFTISPEGVLHPESVVHWNPPPSITSSPFRIRTVRAVHSARFSPRICMNTRPFSTTYDRWSICASASSTLRIRRSNASTRV